MKFGRFKNAAKGMVNDLFAAEAHADFHEAQQTQISVKVQVPTAAMLAVLSEIFGQSRFAFSGEILEDFTADLFANMPNDKRAEIAAKADKITTEILTKQGITITSHGPAGSGLLEDQTWRGLAAVDYSLYLDDCEPLEVVK
jgi:hypothetical protein